MTAWQTVLRSSSATSAMNHDHVAGPDHGLRVRVNLSESSQMLRYQEALRLDGRKWTNLKRRVQLPLLSFITDESRQAAFLRALPSEAQRSGLLHRKVISRVWRTLRL